MQEYTGATLDEFRDWADGGFVHPDDLSIVREFLGTALRTGHAGEVVTRIRRSDGVYRWFQVRGLPHRDRSGNILCWYFLLTDIDDRKRAEVELTAGL